MSGLYTAMNHLAEWLTAHQLPAHGVKVHVTFAQPAAAHDARAWMRRDLSVTSVKDPEAFTLCGLDLRFEHEGDRPPPMTLREQIARKINPQAFNAGWVTDSQKADALKRADEIVALLKAGEP